MMVRLFRAFECIGVTFGALSRVVALFKLIDLNSQRFVLVLNIIKFYISLGKQTLRCLQLHLHLFGLVLEGTFMV
jgi:hypothetical protein